jgi:polyhydroxybutyrate depolymerase
MMSDYSVDAMNTSIDVDGTTRTYTVVGNAPATTLILVFHGSRQSGQIHRAFTGAPLERLVVDGRAVVAYLDGYKGNWNDFRRESYFPARKDNVDDVAFARSVVHAITESHGIRRVIAVGYSNGGQLVFRLLHEAPELLAGAVAVAATMPDRDGFLGDFSEDPVDRPVPVTLVLGDADRIVPYAGGRMAWWARAAFRIDGRALSAGTTAAYFANRNDSASEPTSRVLPHRSGRTTTEVHDYGKGVTLVTVHGGGHTVPSHHPGPAIVGRTGDDFTIDEIVEQLL